MNARLLVAFLCLSAASTGCIIVDRGDDPCCDTPSPAQPGDVSFFWSFPVGNGRCLDVPEVKNVRITIPGETLHNGGFYACNTASVDGITLHDFVPGSYSYTVEALDYSDNVLFRSSGSFVVNGNVRVNTTLTPTGSPSSYSYISWRFPPNSVSGNPNCNQAGVTRVDVSIDGGAWQQFDCAAGSSVVGNAVQSAYLEPGTHSIQFIGVGSDGKPYYYASGSLSSQSGSPAHNDYSLWAVGGMSLRWELLDGSTFRTCAEAGVTQVVINLENVDTGELVYGEVGDTQSCTGAPIIYRFLKPGDYRVYIRGTGPGNVFYTNEYAVPPVLSVVAFQQKEAQDAYSAAIYRQP